MTELIWMNGKVMPLTDATVGVEDRGYQFADGVYEVIRFYGGRTFSLAEHLDRLQRSATDLMLKVPVSKESLMVEIPRLVERSGLREGMIYLQLTRGQAERNHIFPDCPPTLLFYTRQLPPLPEPGTAPGIKLISALDERWKRCWIKSIALLPNVLAKNVAIAAGADEAVFIDNGIVTECCASNFFAVIGGRVHTHPVGPKVLPGITRLVLSQVAGQVGVGFVERAMSEEEAMDADEVFITSTTREISWVMDWNDRRIADRCGPTTLRLHKALRQRINRETA